MPQLKISSQYKTDGALSSTWLHIHDGALTLQDDNDAPRPLSLQAILGAFARYGKPLDASPEPQDWLGELSLSDTITLRAFRFMNWGDVYKTDYLCLVAPPAEPLVAPAPLIRAALNALSMAILKAGNREQGTGNRAGTEPGKA